MIEEVKTKKKAKPPKKKPHILLRFILFVLTLALILGAVFLVVNRDKLNFDAFKRWFSYRSLSQSDTTGGGEAFPYQGGKSMTLANLDGDLLAVSESGVRLYSPGGTAYVEETALMTYPTCQVAGDYAVVYDAGGTFLRVYHDREQVFAPEGEAAILSARVNPSGWLSVITRSTGYKGMISVYDASSQLRLKLNISTSFVLDSLVSPDNRTVLLVTAKQENQLFSATLAQYSITEVDEKDPQPIATLPLGNQLPLDLSWQSGGLRVISEYSAIAAGKSLAQTGQYDWSDRYLKRFSLLSDDSFVVLTGKYRSGSQSRLEVVDTAGAVLAQREETRPILSLSAAGKYIAVLTADALTIYTQDLEPYATMENTQNADQVVALPDGCAYLTSGDVAWLYLPS